MNCIWSNQVTPFKTGQSVERQLDLLGGLGNSSLTVTNRKDSSPVKKDPVDMSFASSSADSPSPKSLLIVDTETTGLNPEFDECIEIGAILFHVNSRSILAQQSFLLPVSSNGAESINRIPAEVSISFVDVNPILTSLILAYPAEVILDVTSRNPPILKLC